MISSEILESIPNVEIARDHRRTPPVTRARYGVFWELSEVHDIPKATIAKEFGFWKTTVNYGIQQEWKRRTSK